MARFLAGLLVGLLVGGGGAYFFFGRTRADATTVAAVPAADAGVTDPAGKKKKGKGRAGGSGRRAGGGAEDYADEPVPVITAADLTPGAEGDSLKPRPRDVDLSAGSAEVRDLSQGEIDGTLGAAKPGVVDCITQARGPAPITGTIEVGMIVDPDGKVIRTRVEAPAYLLRHGLYRCVRREIAGLRFPAVGRDTVVSFPVNLE